MSLRPAPPIVDPEVELTTTQAARRLGVSRQHLVDLCDRGLIPHRRIGTHRRVRAEDLARHLDEVSTTTSPLTRKDRVSLAIHYLVAERLLTDEARVRARALRNLETMRRANKDRAATSYLAEWQRLVEGPVEPLLITLTSLEHRARDLRNVTPFAGVITDAERWNLIRAIR